jgi:hypothetical protein
MFNLKKIQQEKEQAKTSGQKASVGTLRLQKGILPRRFARMMVWRPNRAR